MSVHLHIVPSVPPAFNGLGDYCYQLWKHWPEPRPEWHVAVADMPKGAQEAWPDAIIHPFEQNGDDLLRVLQQSGASKVVLHYVGYGYARRGAPGWLPRALATWKKRTGGKLVVMFHELYATGPPWKSEFWFCLAQRKVVVDLLRIADRWITSCPRYMGTLQNHLHADAERGTMIPIPATIETEAEPDWARPWPLSVGLKLRLVVFGMPLTRLRALRCHQNLLRALASQNLIEELVLMGKEGSSDSIEEESEAILGSLNPAVTIRRVYGQPSQVVSKEFRGCHLGLVSNPPEILYKSTVYAGLATHGVLAIVPTSTFELDGAIYRNADAPNSLDLEAIRACYLGVRPFAEQLTTRELVARFAQVVEAA